MIQACPTDQPDVDGANHHYEIVVRDNSGQVVQRTELHFQQGGLQEAGINGLSDQVLLAVVLDRWRGFQRGPFSARENSIAITKLEEALLWNAKRYIDRAARGVEGKREV